MKPEYLEDLLQYRTAIESYLRAGGHLPTP